MTTRNFLTDLQTDSEIRIKSVKNPSAQTNTLCDVVNVEKGINDRILTTIELLKKHDYSVYVVARLQYENGLRISEVLNINHTNLVKGGRILIKGLKGSENKVVSCSWCCEWLKSRMYLNGGIFSGVDRFYVYRLYKKVGLVFNSQLSSRQSVTHSLRHLYVKELRESGIDDKLIQKSIGHKNESNTEKYGKSK